jgi:hypothetical protein
VKPSGPDQYQDVPCATDKLSVFPEQTGVLLDETGVGKEFTVIEVLVKEVQPFASLTVTV